MVCEEKQKDDEMLSTASAEAELGYDLQAHFDKAIKQADKNTALYCAINHHERESLDLRSFLLHFRNLDDFLLNGQRLDDLLLIYLPQIEKTEEDIDNILKSVRNPSQASNALLSLSEQEWMDFFQKKLGGPKNVETAINYLDQGITGILESGIVRHLNMRQMARDQAPTLSYEIPRHGNLFWDENKNLKYQVTGDKMTVKKAGTDDVIGTIAFKGTVSCTLKPNGHIIFSGYTDSNLIRRCFAGEDITEQAILTDQNFTKSGPNHQPPKIKKSPSASDSEEEQKEQEPIRFEDLPENLRIALTPAKECEVIEALARDLSRDPSRITFGNNKKTLHKILTEYATANTDAKFSKKITEKANVQADDTDKLEDYIAENLFDTLNQNLTVETLLDALAAAIFPFDRIPETHKKTLLKALQYMSTQRFLGLSRNAPDFALAKLSQQQDSDELICHSLTLSVGQWSGNLSYKADQQSISFDSFIENAELQDTQTYKTLGKIPLSHTLTTAHFHVSNEPAEPSFTVSQNPNIALDTPEAQASAQKELDFHRTCLHQNNAKTSSFIKAIPSINADITPKNMARDCLDLNVLIRTLLPMNLKITTNDYPKDTYETEDSNEDGQAYKILRIKRIPITQYNRSANVLGYLNLSGSPAKIYFKRNNDGTYTFDRVDTQNLLLRKCANGETVTEEDIYTAMAEPKFLPSPRIKEIKDLLTIACQDHGLTIGDIDPCDIHDLRFTPKVPERQEQADPPLLPGNEDENLHKTTLTARIDKIPVMKGEETINYFGPVTVTYTKKPDGNFEATSCKSDQPFLQKLLNKCKHRNDNQAQQNPIITENELRNSYQFLPVKIPSGTFQLPKKYQKLIYSLLCTMGLKPCMQIWASFQKDRKEYNGCGYVGILCLKTLCVYLPRLIMCFLTLGPLSLKNFFAHTTAYLGQASNRGSLLDIQYPKKNAAWVGRKILFGILLNLVYLPLRFLTQQKEFMEAAGHFVLLNCPPCCAKLLSKLAMAISLVLFVAASIALSALVLHYLAPLMPVLCPLYYAAGHVPFLMPLAHLVTAHIFIPIQEIFTTLGQHLHCLKPFFNLCQSFFSNAAKDTNTILPLAITAFAAQETLTACEKSASQAGLFSCSRSNGYEKLADHDLDNKKYDPGVPPARERSTTGSSVDYSSSDNV